MAVDVTAASCRAVLVFALKREAEPLVWRFGLYPFWDEPARVYGVRTAGWEDDAPPVPGAGDVLVAVAGMGPAAAAAETRRVLARFPRPGVVVTVGICGGLRDGLGVADVVVPAEVVAEDGRRWPCAAFGPPAAGRLLTAERLVGDREEKRRLGAVHQADAVDMEAAAVAEACAAAGVPFAAVKAVSDPVAAGLPPELPRIAPDGRPRFGRLLAAVVRRPRLLGELLRFDRDCRRAAWVACERIQQAFDLVPDYQRGPFTGPRS